MKMSVKRVLCVCCIAALLISSAQANLLGRYDCQDPDGLVNWAPFSSWGDPTNHGAAEATGVIDHGLYFLNKDIVDLESKLSATGDWTLAGWVRLANTSNRCTLFGQYSGGTASGRAYLMAADGNLGGKARLFVDGGVSLNGTTEVDDFVWHLVSATRQGDTFTLYVDGVAEASVTVGGISVDQGTDLVIGNLGETSYYGSSYIGNNIVIDEAAVWDEALSAADMALLYERIRLAGQAFNPDPATDSVVDPSLASLSWQLPLPYDMANDANSVVCSVLLGDDETMATATEVVTEARAESVAVSLVPGTTYYWRVDTLDGTVETIGDVWSFTAVPLTAWSPSPADGAVDVSAWPDYSWTPGVAADIQSYKLYVSDVESDVVNRTVTAIDTTDPNYFSPDTSALEFGTTIYWAVDEITGTGTVPGDVWSFTTINYRMIEPMGYGTSANLQTVWTGDPNLPLGTTDNRMRMRYYDVANSYEREIGVDADGIDFSTAEQIAHYLRLETLPDGAPMTEYPQFTLQLLDAADTVLYASNPANYDTEVLAAAVGYIEGGTLMRYDLSGTSGLENVRTIKFIVDGYPYFQTDSTTPADWRGVVVDDIYIAGVTCTNSPEFDFNDDCVVDLSDFAEFAATWLECGRYPTSACPQ